MKKGFSTNIERDSLLNTDFRRVLYTAEHMQLVLMSLKSGEDIGEEIHTLDQFIRVEKGEGNAYLNGHIYPLLDGSIVLVPAGTKHNIVNTGEEDLKLYTLYAPPEHKDKTIHRTKEDALAHEEHFDGETTES
ncbi:MAG: cupin domain-containing protein [Patescibacteria group bacterium]